MADFDFNSLRNPEQFIPGENITGTSSVRRRTVTEATSVNPEPKINDVIEHNLYIDLEQGRHCDFRTSEKNYGEVRRFRARRLTVFITHNVMAGKTHYVCKLSGPRVKKDGSLSDKQTCSLTVEKGADDGTINYSNAKKTVNGIVGKEASDGKRYSEALIGDPQVVKPYEIVGHHPGDVARWEAEMSL